jgi:ADP-ribose pyrophosphatase
MTSGSDAETLFEGHYLRLLRKGRWEFVQRTKSTGIVVLVPVTVAGEVVLVEQLRPPLGRRVIELPAGLVGDVEGAEDEDLEVAARRELLEETGYQAADLRFLTAGPISAGLSTEIITVYLARDVKKVAPGGGDESENIVVHAVPLDQVGEWLANKEREGVLADAKVYSGLFFATRGVPGCEDC